MRAERDYVDLVLEQWAHERPDLDLSPLGVIGRISRISRYFELHIEEALAQYGLNAPAFYVLAALRRSGPPFTLSPTALYSALLVSSGAMTNRIDRLEAAGLVRRVNDPGDGRALLVALTPKGRKLIDFALVGHNENERRLLDPLTPGERDELATLLRRLLTSAAGAAAGREEKVVTTRPKGKRLQGQTVPAHPPA